MLRSRKIRPIVRTERYLGPKIDLGNEGFLLVETPTAKLILVKGFSRGKKEHVAARLLVVRNTGKITTVAAKGRFTRERFAKYLSKIADYMKADIQPGDLDPRQRDFTTVFEEA